MKTHTTLTADFEKMVLAKKLKINLSKLFNDSLTALISSYQGVDVDIFEVEKELELINKKMVELSNRKQELLAQQFAIEQKRNIDNQKEIKEAALMANAIKAKEAYEYD